MDLGILFFTWWKGKFVGSDEFGNQYYQERRNKKSHKAKRWVIYKGKAEASKIPASWHGWLHYTFDDIPSCDNKPYKWQKGHLPNLTGTPLAHCSDQNSRLYPNLTKRKACDYEPWKP